MAICKSFLMVGSEDGASTDESASAASGSSVTTTNENTNENKQENKNENTNSNSGRKRRDVVGSSEAFAIFWLSQIFPFHFSCTRTSSTILFYVVWMYSLGSSSTSTVFGGTSVNNAINQNRRKRMLFPSNFLGKRTKNYSIYKSIEQIFNWMDTFLTCRSGPN